MIGAFRKYAQCLKVLLYLKYLTDTLYGNTPIILYAYLKIAVILPYIAAKLL